MREFIGEKRDFSTIEDLLIFSLKLILTYIKHPTFQLAKKGLVVLTQVFHFTMSSAPLLIWADPFIFNNY